MGNDQEEGMTEVRLTEQQAVWLAGRAGAGKQKAMEIVVALAQIYRAADLVPVEHAHIAGVSYKNLGDAGIAFLSEWADAGAQVQVPTTLNPMGMARDRWQVWGLPASFAEPQLAAVAVFEKMGVRPELTCTPYQLPGYVPSFGSHLAWSESSAVAFANSVLGARTNREGGPSALAAAIVGCTGRYGMHLDQEREGQIEVIVRCPIRDLADFGALSYLVGKSVGTAVPWFVGLAEWLPALSDARALDLLKGLGAGLAAYGSVALYHIEDYTPEAHAAGRSLLRRDAPRLEIDDLAPAYAYMNNAADERQVDLVTIGCPHASLAEIREVAEALHGRHLKTRLWVTTAAEIRRQAGAAGWVASIEDAGGEVVADTCAVVAPMHLLGVRSMATNAGKMACYAPMHSKVRMHFGTLQQCLATTLSGVWGPAPHAAGTRAGN
jgi:predicted aconitase